MTSIGLKKYRLGDMIFPNECHRRLFEKKAWAVVVKVYNNPRGMLKEMKWFYCLDCAELYSKLIKEKVIK